MKHLGKLAVLGAVLAASASFAHASLILDSNSGTTSLIADTGGITPGAAVNLTTNLSPWIGPIGTSTWVGPVAGTNPGGVVVPDGTYTYQATFSETAGGLSAGAVISVLADDTTSIVINGTQITPDAGASKGPACTTNTPNCVTVFTITIPGGDLKLGTNTLQFVVDQDFESATGLDFEVNTAVSPEPSSLMLLGTGLMGAAGMLFRRRQQSVL